MQIAIVRARIPKDCKALAAFDRKTFPNTTDHSTPAYYRMRGLRSFWLLCNGRRIGASSLQHNATFTEDPALFSLRTRGVLYVTSTAILPSARGLGMGDIFKTWHIVYARKHGFQSIVTNVRTSNIASIHLNLKHGFVPIYTRPNSYPDGESTIVLQLQLTPAQ